MRTQRGSVRQRNTAQDPQLQHLTVAHAEMHTEIKITNEIHKPCQTQVSTKYKTERNGVKTRMKNKRKESRDGGRDEEEEDVP